MIKLGEVQTLFVVKTTEHGVYLNDVVGKEEGSILLPNKWVPEDTVLREPLRVFVYRDSEDRLIATTQIPKITLGQIAVLQVKEVGRIGAFLDWGLEKDLFLPFKEGKVEAGRNYPVALYIDKSERLCATTHIQNYLREDSPFQKDDQVTGIVYSFNPRMGAFVAVDNQFFGMIPVKELFRQVRVGDTVHARVTGVREDGKLNLSVREKAYVQMDFDSQLIYERLRNSNGTLPFSDKSDPELIKKEFGLSKAAFKRAIGRLLKEKKIKITEKEIQLV